MCVCVKWNQIKFYVWQINLIDFYNDQLGWIIEVVTNMITFKEIATWEEIIEIGITW